MSASKNNVLEISQSEIVIHPADLQALQEVEAHSAAKAGFSVLRPIGNMAEGDVKRCRSLAKDLRRNLYLNGKNSPLEFRRFLEQNNISDIEAYKAIREFFAAISINPDPLLPGYSQDTTQLTKALMILFPGKIENLMSGDAEFVSHSVFAQDENTINVTGVCFNPKLIFMNMALLKGGKYKGEPQTNRTIPGEIFITAQTHVEGGLQVRSVSASNELLQKLLEYTPHRVRAMDPEKEDILTYTPLEVYGREIVDASGQLNEANFAKAVELAQAEEDRAQANLTRVKDSFNTYVDLQNDEALRQIQHLLSLRSISDSAKRQAEESPAGMLSVDGENVVTLNTAMATAIYRDLPAVLSGNKPIADCPLLLKAIVWCGDPTLSNGLKTILIAKIGVEELNQGLSIYGSGDNMADFAQVYMDSKGAEQELIALRLTPEKGMELEVEDNIAAIKAKAKEQIQEEEKALKEEKAEDKKEAIQAKITAITANALDLIDKQRRRTLEETLAKLEASISDVAKTKRIAQLHWQKAAVENLRVLHLEEQKLAQKLINLPLTLEEHIVAEIAENIADIKVEAKEQIHQQEKALAAADSEEAKQEIKRITENAIDLIDRQRRRVPKKEVVTRIEAEMHTLKQKIQQAEMQVAMASMPLSGTSCPVSMRALHRVEENCNDSIREFGILRAVARNEDKTVKKDLEQVFKDIDRDFSVNGKNTTGLFPDTLTLEQKEERMSEFSFTKKHMEALAFGYSQGVSDLTSFLGLAFRIDNDRIPGFSIISAGSRLSSGFAFVRDAQAINLGTVSSDLELNFVDEDGNPASIVIPGEIFVAAKTHPAGGFEILSVRASNPLLKALLEYTPLRTEDADGQRTVLTYPPLSVYGIEIVDASGVFHQERLSAAVVQAQKEEEIAQLTLECAKDQFTYYCEKQQDAQKLALESIMTLMQKHSKVKGFAYTKRLVNGEDAVTLDTAMLTALYRDLPAILSADKPIEDCPALVNAIIWCGVPELTEALKAILIPKVGEERLNALLCAYGSGDEIADLAQAYQDAPEDKKEAARKNWETMAMTNLDSLRGKSSLARLKRSSQTLSTEKERIEKERDQKIETAKAAAENELTKLSSQIYDKKEKILSAQSKAKDLKPVLDDFYRVDIEFKAKKKQAKEPSIGNVLKNIGFGMAVTTFTILTAGMGLLAVGFILNKRKNEKIRMEKQAKEEFVQQATSRIVELGVDVPSDVTFDNFGEKLREKIEGYEKAIVSEKKAIVLQEEACQRICNAFNQLQETEAKRKPEEEAMEVIARSEAVLIAAEERVVAAEMAVNLAKETSISAAVKEKAVMSPDVGLKLDSSNEALSFPHSPEMGRRVNDYDAPGVVSFSQMAHVGFSELHHVSSEMENKPKKTLKVGGPSCDA